MTRPLLLLLLLLASLTGCQRAFFATLNAGKGTTGSQLAYGPHPSHVLDLYRPQQASAPVVLFLYGGRWQGGRRQDYAFVGEALATQGVLVLVPDYRHFPEVRFPGFMHDAALALRWARDNAGAHGGDPARLFVAGHSAGAHIAALLATDARHLAGVGMRPADLAGVIGIAGPYDFLPLTEDDLKAIFGPEADWPQSQPVNFVDGDEPPFLLLHGDDDRLVWSRNSASLDARLRSIGGSVDYREYRGLGHIRILTAFRYPRLASTLEDTLRFIHAAP